MNKSQRVLKFVEYHGRDGAKFTDIQRFICEMNGWNWEERSEPYYDKETKTYTRKIGSGARRRHRGVWCTNLIGSGGILNAWCYKNPHGRWVLAEMPTGVIYRQFDTKAAKFNKTVLVGQQTQHQNSLPTCPSCKKKVWNHKSDIIWKESDHMACGSIYSFEYSSDCTGRVWFRDGNYPHEQAFLTDLTTAQADAHRDANRAFQNDETEWGERSKMKKDLMVKFLKRHIKS